MSTRKGHVFGPYSRERIGLSLRGRYGTETRMDRFWQRVECREPDECWPWLGTVHENGYATFGRDWAHRLAYQDRVGPVPNGLELDHLCRNTQCVNPRHLEAVTHAENMRRSIRPHCRRGHLFTPANTYAKTNGRRQCRECLRIGARRRYSERVVMFTPVPA